jgi:hypothetical protein
MAAGVVTETHEVDLDHDTQNDIVLIVRSHDIRRLVIVMRWENQDLAFAYRLDSNEKVRFARGRELNETKAGPGRTERKVHRTDGVYLELSQPEGARRAIYWNGKEFVEIWTAD